jgi:hypothetical protein
MHAETSVTYSPADIRLFSWLYYYVYLDACAQEIISAKGKQVIDRSEIRETHVDNNLLKEPYLFLCSPSWRLQKAGCAEQELRVFGSWIEVVIYQLQSLYQS